MEQTRRKRKWHIMRETKRTNLGRKQRERKIRGKDSTLKKVEAKKLNRR
jgi:hypothetical protein